MNIDEIKARLNAATSGPWYTDEYAEGEYQVVVLVNHYLFVDPVCKGDAEFIAHAKEDIEFLLAEVESQKYLKLECMDKLADALIRAEKSETALATTQQQLDTAVEALEGIMGWMVGAEACKICKAENCGITHIPPTCKPQWIGRKENE